MIKRRYAWRPCWHSNVNTDGKHEVNAVNGVMKMMFSGLQESDSLTISPFQCHAVEPLLGRTSSHARMLGGTDPKTLCLQGGDAHKMVGRSSTIHSVTDSSTPCGITWARRDRWPCRARTPGAPGPSNEEPLQAHRATYLPQSKPRSEVQRKPKSNVNSLSTSIPLSLLR